MLTIVFRVDACLESGSGHFMRCVALARGFIKRGHKVYFIMRTFLPSSEGILKASEINFRSLPDCNERCSTYAHSEWLACSETKDADQLLQLVKNNREEFKDVALVVVDNYALAEHWESAVQKYFPVLAIDDLSDRPHSAKWVLDQTVGKSARDYVGLVTSKTRLMLGPKFALLRDEFSELRDQAMYERSKPKEFNNLLVTLGGVDKGNVTRLVMKALTLSNYRFNVTVIVGDSNPHYESLVAISRNVGYPVVLLRQVTDMAQQMLKSHLCIGAAGSTSWERCTLGLPTINLVIAENQYEISRNLHNVGAALDFGELSCSRVTELANRVDDFENDPESRMVMSKKAFQVCDGRGVKRIIEKVTH